MCRPAQSPTLTTTLLPTTTRCRSVQHYERSAYAARPHMEQPCDDLLARPRRPRDEHAAARRRHALDRLSHGVDRRRDADQFARAAGAQPQFGVLPAKLGGLDRAFDHEQPEIRLDRLFDEVVSAVPDRRSFHLDFAVTPVPPARHERMLPP